MAEQDHANQGRRTAPASGPRLSIIPAAAVLDPNLEGSDLRVLCALGMNINDAGWCQRSQVKLAKQLHVSRSTVQRSLTRLADAGWVQIKVVSDATGRDCPHWYRVVLDPPDAPATTEEIIPVDNDAAQLDLKAPPAHRRAPLPVGGQGVPTQGGHPPAHTGRAPKNDPIKNDPSMNDKTPRAERGVERSKSTAVMDELRTALDEEHALAVIDHRKTMRRPLTVHAAKLLARQFALMPDPNAAADLMIGNGWQGFKPEWAEDRRGNSPARITSPPRRSEHQQRQAAAMAACDRAMKENRNELSRDHVGADLELGPSDFRVV